MHKLSQLATAAVYPLCVRCRYKCVIHECTFLGPPTDALDASSRRKGHTHYAQLHPFIAAFPQVTKRDETHRPPPTHAS